ncbi:MAG: CDP-diacylglycerol--serine O-phosphatidyltransferase [Endomicrobiaceae bacterium]|nr:CDP-diacylglycerol--serine O-phosphatidyltransferase [Endomicrobiaceae bacterium]
MPSLRKGLYVLPSLFTAGNLSAGFISILYAIDGNFNVAAWFIMLAILFDMLDGRVARLTKTMSKFGMEFDSLCDLISFGVAPAILMYQLVLNSMGNVGIAIALLFVITSATRLAKFNVKAMEPIDNAKKTSDSFAGLPTPASAGVIASFVLSYEIFDGTVLSFKTIPLLMKKMPFFFEAMPIIMVIISFLMVSNVPYNAFKKMKWSRPKSIQFFVLLVVFLIAVFSYPQNMFFIIFFGYSLSGIVFIIVRYYRVKKALIKAYNEKKNKHE